jgi:O-antigen/teichoic acid export membrane protein
LLAFLGRIQKILIDLFNHKGFRSYLFNTSWMLAEQVLRMMVGIFIGAWMARYLGPERFGIFSYALAFVALFGAIANLGLDGVLNREFVKYPSRNIVYIGTAFWIKIVGAVVALLMITIVLPFTSNDDVTNLYILIIGAGLIFQSFLVIDVYFRSVVLAKYVSICKTAQLALSSCLKLYLIFVNADLFWFVLLTVVDQVTLAVMLTFAYWKKTTFHPYPQFDLSLGKTLLREAVPLILSGAAVMIYMRIDQVMIKEMLSDRDVGLYSAAVKISEAWYFIPTIVTSSLFPAIVRARSISTELYLLRLGKLYFLMFLVAVLVAVPISLISRCIIITLYGDGYKAAAEILSIHIWAGVFVGIGVANGSWFLSENLQVLLAKNTIIGAVLNISLNLALIPRWGGVGAAFATLISYACSAYFLLLLDKRSRKVFFHISKSIILS